MTVPGWLTDKMRVLNVYARLSDLETFINEQIGALMAQIDDLTAANARLVKVSMALGQIATDQKKIIDDLRTELSAVKAQTLAPEAVQAVIESANAAADAGEQAAQAVSI